MKYKYLSHTLEDTVPAYGGNAHLDARFIRNIDAGDPANAVSITLRSHWGTHIDAPRHFYRDGKRITDYAAEHFVFEKPHVIRLTISPAELFSSVNPLMGVPEDADILLFQTGWSALRNHPDYCLNNPGIHPDVCRYLRRTYPDLRAIGIDWISVSSYQHRELGREAHRVLLNPGDNDNALIIVEDMDLTSDLDALQTVYAIPLRVGSFDSAPCTVLGAFRD